MDIEAALLTGGASRRMGQDKGALEISGVPLAVRIARSLSEAGHPVTVLGRTPLAGFDFLPDEVEFAGPAAALSRFEPRLPWVFVVSCDLPRFDSRIVAALAMIVADADAAIPLWGGRPQPLCGLYQARAFAALRRSVDAGDRSMMGWLERLVVHEASEDALLCAGIDPSSLRSVNTPEDWREIEGG